jgi:two-component system OmpR family sensor kinase/two-component system sensor histidine kinase BaeS
VVSAAERVASGDFSTRLTERGSPWLRSVAAAFNRMTSTLQRQQQQRRDLMADIAHELRTPLSVMQGRLEGMLDGVYPRDERHVAQVLDETRMLARLVEDLRTLAHSESGTLTLEKEPTDLGVLVYEALAALKPDADTRSVTVQAQVPAELPLLDLDPLRMREVVTNLVANAIRYSPAGGTVHVEVATTPATLTMRIRDGGTGIAQDDLPRIFDRFYKGTGSTGSGLGLTIARNLVTAHGGTLTAESRIGVGTTMTVEISRGQTPS